MDFALSEEQEMLVEAARTALSRTAGITQVREALNAGRMLAPAWEAFAEAGLLGILAPQSVGGVGLGWLEAALVVESAGHFAAPLPLVSHYGATAILSEAGDTTRPILEAAVAGEAPVVLATAEQTGWRSEQFRVGRTDVGLNGVKRHVAFAPDAAWLLVLGADFAAMADPAARGVGVSPPSGIDAMPYLADITLDDCPASILEANSDTFDRARAGVLVLSAASALGAASAAIERTIGYVGDRQQFGQPLAAFQAVRHDLADQATAIESARSLMWYTASLLDEGAPDADRVAKIAKAHITEQAVAAIRRCVVLHGAIGFAWECDLHLWLKHAMLSWAQYGTPDALRREVAEGDRAAA